MAKSSKQTSKSAKPGPAKDTDQKSTPKPARQSTTRGVAKTGPAAGPPTGRDHKTENALTPGETPPPVPENTGRKGVLAPALIGGFLAALLGFVAARTEILDPILPGALKGPDFEQAAADLRQADVRQAGDLAALRAEFNAFEQPDLGPINTRLSSIHTELAALRADSDTQQAHLRDLEARLEPLGARVNDLEKRPMTDGASKAAIAAYDRELEALRTAIAAQRADVENLVAEARATRVDARNLEQNAALVARNTEIRATMTGLQAALNAGASYAGYLSKLEEAGVLVPDVLKSSAGDGVASPGSLGAAFPKAARSALSAARSEAGDGGGLAGFLQRQLGARSVQPREGDDVDAILSRAEAALTDGQLEQALKEVAALPEVARVEMQDWSDIATTRLQALRAADELAQSLNSN